MIRTKDFSDIAEAIVLLDDELELAVLPDEMEILIEKGDNLKISCHGTKVSLQCKEKIQIFRALGLLVQKIKEGITDFELEEEIQFAHSGIMFDVSRNAVLKVDTIKKLLRYMAVMGLDTAMLYMEDIYEVKDYPYFGYMRGRYSFEELQECDRYAEKLGIEIIPCIQALGHLETALRWDYANDIRDTAGVLMVGEEKTYQLIEAMIQAVSAPFRSRRINLGMDEAWGMGTGAYMRKNGYRNSFDIMTEHLNRVLEITNRHGLKAMIWSDMFFRLGSQTQDYYDKEIAFPEGLREKIPAELELGYWDYYHTTTEDYDFYIRKHQELSDNIVFIGGIWTWQGIAPKHNHTTISTNCGLEVCKKNGIREAYGTLWGDNGAEVSIMTALYGMQQYAEHTYHRKPEDAEIRKRFAFCVKEDPEPYIALSEIDELQQEGMADYADPSKWILWQDLLRGLFDFHLAQMDLKGYYGNLAEKFYKAKARTKAFALLYDFYAKLCDVLDIKWDLGLRIKKAYDIADKTGLQKIISDDLQQLKDKTELLRKAHRALWFSTNKTFGFDVLDIRYGGLLTKIDTAEYLLRQYIDGTLNRIEELEQEKLPFHQERIPLGNLYDKIVTVSPFM